MATKEKTATYTVQLAKNFTQPTRWRIGIKFTRNEPQVLELTKEQVEAIKDDRYMEIKKGAPKDKSADAGSSESDVLPTGADATPEVDAENETSTDETNTTDEEENTGDETQEDAPAVDQKAKLLQKSRNRVNALAKAAGVESPETLPNKEAVVDALLAKGE